MAKSCDELTPDGRKKVDAFRVRHSTPEALAREQETREMADDEQQVMRELPRYKCHKEVWALKIKSVDFKDADGTGDAVYAVITPEEAGYAPFRVDAAYLDKHNPRPGGYYVVYQDGYKSYSPAQAFEEGYTRL